MIIRRCRQFFVSCRALCGWFEATFNGQSKVGATPRLLAESGKAEKVGAVRRQLASEKEAVLSTQSAVIGLDSSVPPQMGNLHRTCECHRATVLDLCRNADDTQVRLALSPAAKKVGVATYETALPDTRLIRQRLEQIVIPKEESK